MSRRPLVVPLLLATSLLAASFAQSATAASAEPVLHPALTATFLATSYAPGSSRNCVSAAVSDS